MMQTLHNCPMDKNNFIANELTVAGFMMTQKHCVYDFRCL